MSFINNLFKSAIGIGLVACFLLGCKKSEEPTPTAPNSGAETSIKMDATYTNPNQTVVVSDTLNTYKFKSLFTNNKISSISASDTIFIWERVSAALPQGWIVYICAAKVCHTAEVLKSEFTVLPNGKTDFYIHFDSFDKDWYANSFGKGTASAEYVIYRKGMRKEDGIKVTIKMETK